MAAGPDMTEGGEVVMRQMTVGDIDGVLEGRKGFAAPWTRGMFEILCVACRH